MLDLSLAPSNFAASDAVLSGRTVLFVELDILRVCSGRSVRSRDGESNRGPGDTGSLEGDRISLEGDRNSLEGELGGSPAFAVPPVFSHGGAFCEVLPVVAWRRGPGLKVPNVSFGFSGELVGVEGRAVEGPCLMEPGRRKGDCRELLKKSGDGLESVGADCCMLVYHYRIKDPALCIP